VLIIKNTFTQLIIGLAIGLLLGGIIGYLLGNSFHSFPQRGNFQISDTQKTEVTSIFTTATQTEIESYCQKNQMLCGYYCRSVDSSNEICSKMQTPDRNFSRGYP